MQTFLPYPDFGQSAQALDDQRLQNQINEAYVLWKTLTGGYAREGRKGWPHHPATRMWAGYANALARYRAACIAEWQRRRPDRAETRSIADTPADSTSTAAPPWLGNPKFHASHRSNLLRKNERYYRQLGWTEPTDMPYVWPTKKQ